MAPSNISRTQDGQLTVASDARQYLQVASPGATGPPQFGHWSAPASVVTWVRSSRIEGMADFPVQKSDEEWRTRVALAACYRLVHRFGMSDQIYNHISARIPGGEDQHFLVNA